MKIKYNLEYNYFSFYDEVQGILMKKKEILKGSKKIDSYTKEGMKYLKIIGILFVLFLISILFPVPTSFETIIKVLFSLSIGIIVAYYAVFYLSYFEDRKRCHRGELQFSKTGILDVLDDGVKMGLPWHLIDFAVITNKVVCFVTKTSIVYFVDASKREEVIEALEKYQSELKVMDLGKLAPKIEMPKEEIEKSVELEEEEEIESLEIEENDDEVEKAIEELEKE